MNASLITADLSTHIRIVLIALLAAMVVVWAGATSRLTRTDVMSAQIQLRGPVLKARGPVGLASGSVSWLALKRVQLPERTSFCAGSV